MAEIESVSCVRWEPRARTENPYVRITKEYAGCFAYVGAVLEGVLNLGNNCVVS